MSSLTITYRLDDAGRKQNLLIGGDGKQIQEMSIWNNHPLFKEILEWATVDNNGNAVWQASNFSDVCYSSFSSTQTVESLCAAKKEKMEKDILEYQEKLKETTEVLTEYFKQENLVQTKLPIYRKSVAYEYTGWEFIKPKNLWYESILKDEPIVKQYQEYVEEMAAKVKELNIPLKETAIQEIEMQEQIKQEKEEKKEQAKKDFIKNFIYAHGTEIQRSKLRDGFLGEEEVKIALREYFFRSLDGHFPRYEKLRWQDVCDCGNDGQYVEYEVEECDSLSDKQYTMYKYFLQRMPEATITPKKHTATSSCCERTGIRFSLLVTIQVEMFTFSREYALED
jgi:hypothetical protein